MKQKNSLLFLLLISALGLSAQNITLFRTIYFPAEPYGGIKEMEEFVKQEMVYPDSLLDAEIEGDVFITFLIDTKGHIKYKKVEKSGHPLLQKEGSRIFDKIVWVADDERNEDELGYEKLKITFNRKKYMKLVRKRGYHHLPFDSSLSISDRIAPYGLNEVDKGPEIKNAKSVNEFVGLNFKYPSIAMERGISGRVTLKMVIEPYGMVSNVKVMEPLAGGCNEETERLVKLMRFTPAMKEGKAVRCFYEYQLNFVNPGGQIR